MHPILQRQLRKLGAGNPAWQDPAVVQLLTLVERTYEELENDRRFAEHTLRTVSEELFSANETIRLESERRLASQGAQLAMALQSSGDGLWSWDAASGWLEFSEAWLQTLGYTREEIPRDLSACELLIFDEDALAARPHVEQFLAGDTTFSREVRLRCKDGALVWSLVRGRVVERDGSGRPSRLVGTVMNISGQKQIESDLRRAKEAAEAANDAKSQFLAMMSHEIRTPMNGVLGFADLLAATVLNAEQKKYLALIESSGQMLVTVINDILDFSRIESGHFEISVELFSPVDIIAEVCDLLRPQAEAKGVALEFVPAIDVRVHSHWSDNVRFRQILLNLVGNSVKFTSRGKVSVKAAVEDDADGREVLVVRVRDSGVGIPQEHLATIFEPFAQGDMSVTRKFGGTGLGLAITKRLVDLMQGGISVTSTVGEGSEFTVSLPRNPMAREGGDKSRESIPQVAEITGPMDRAKVLLVEDNRINRLLALRHLRALGCDVTVAEDGQDAVNLLHEMTFDVVFMDMQMPVMDGLTATKRIREIPGRERMPIIALTANALETDRKLCSKAGMNGFVSKPYEKNIFSRVLSQIETGTLPPI